MHYTSEWPREPEIVIVDDEPSITNLLVRGLNKRGLHRVSVERDPWTVVNRYRPSEPDLLVVDLHMPGIDVFEAIRSLRLVAAPTPHLPVLAMSGDTDEVLRNMAFAAGATDFIAKPFAIADICRRVEMLLDARLVALADARLFGRPSRSFERLIGAPPEVLPADDRREIGAVSMYV